MARKATGQIVERDGKNGRTYALRFRAYGTRRFITTTATSRAEAELELAHVLADVQRGIWQPPRSQPDPPAPEDEPTFHEFASQWVVDREAEGRAARTVEDYKWALSLHLLPFFAGHRLSQITIREVDRYKTAKAAEGILGANAINKTLTRLAQILELAVEYHPGYLPVNPATGKRRRLEGTTPSRSFVEPEQLPSLLQASAKLYGERGRPLVAVLAGAGLRISEALALRREDVDLARGTLTIRASKTEAGVRVVDLTPALREELVLYLADSRWQAPTDLVFPTSTGQMDNRNNVRRRLVVKAVEEANKRLVKLNIAPIGKLSPHGLRHTYASLRGACGDPVALTAEQIGHTDARFTLRVYTHAFKRRQRLTPAERKQYDLALEWAQMGTNDARDDQPLSATETPTYAFPGVS
jgi:integrase